MGVVNAVLINFNFDALITIDVFLLMFPYVLIFLTVMIMRVKEPDTPRSFRVPLPDLGARRLGRLPDRHRHHRPVRQRHGLDHRWPRRRAHRPIAYLVFKNIYKGTTRPMTPWKGGCR